MSSKDYSYLKNGFRLATLTNSPDAALQEQLKKLSAYSLF
jgi:hypothetical protein